MISASDRIVVRPDLIHQRVWMGKQPVWVIKDPVSGDYYYYGDREYEILSIADGRSLMEVIQSCETRSGLASLTPSELSHFLEDAVRKRLISIPGRNRVAHSAPIKRWWRHPLAMRLPGISPTWLLDRIAPIAAPMLSRFGLAVSVLLMVAAAIVVMTQFQAWTDDLALAAQRLTTPRGILAVIVMISVAKVIHELAHAVACRRLGGHVREMGVMLLVGIPCLYCDVSDAWLFDRRWKRMAVSAAGIWAELTLAALATLLWTWTVDGSTRDLCVTLTIVCSVSTVLLNGNPLLRYDGYYLLSDWIGVPNLAGHANTLLRAHTQRWLWGTPVPSAATSWTGVGSGRTGIALMALYGTLSAAYRITILLLISWWIYRGAVRLGVGAPAGLSILGLTSLTIVRRLWQWLRPPRSLVITPQLRTRAATRGLIFMAPIILLLLVPLPHRLVAPMSVEPIGEQTLFVTTAGRIVQQIAEGSSVHAGDVVMVLENLELERKLLEWNATCALLRAQLENVQRQRGVVSDLSQRIPVVTKALSEAEKQLALQQQHARGLTLRAPTDGTVFAAQSRSWPMGDDRVARFWNSTPLHAINHGAWVEQGTVVGLVGDPKQRVAILAVSQDEIELVRIGQPVLFMIASHPRGSITGTVTELATSPMATESDKNLSPTSPTYQVRVRIDDKAVTLPVGLRGTASITVDRSSMIHRIARFLAGAFSQPLAW